jgi:hypothetical protein
VSWPWRQPWCIELADPELGIRTELSRHRWRWTARAKTWLLNDESGGHLRWEIRRCPTPLPPHDPAWP